MKIKSQHLDKLEIVVIFLLLLLYMGAFTIKAPIGNIDNFDYTRQRSVLEKSMAILSYILIPLLIARKWKSCIYLLTKDLPLVVLFVLLGFSIEWSDGSFSKNIDHLRGYLFSNMFGVYLAARFNIKQQTRLLAGVFGIVILFSISVALFVPGYGIQRGVTLLGWTGIFAHKNQLGAFMAWSTLVFLSLSLSPTNSKKSIDRLILWTGFAFSFLLVFLASSAGGIVNLMGVISIIPLSKFFKKTYYKLQVILIISVILLCGTINFLLVANLETIAGMLGKDLTFTGRIPLWNEMLGYIAQKPLLGYGINGFWDSEQYGGVFKSRFFWSAVPHSHNGFIELLLSLGIIGFSLFMISFIVTFLRACRQVYEAKTLEDLVPIQFLFTFFLRNCSESALLVPTNIYLIIYIGMSLSLAIKYRPMRKLRSGAF